MRGRSDFMTNINPCLNACDIALTEADNLLAMLADQPESFDPDIAAVRGRVARLRREVDRLRGLAVPLERGEIDPNRIDHLNFSPWFDHRSAPRGDDQPTKFSR